MTVASLIISILAALSAGGAVFYSRGQKLAAERAAKAAEEALEIQRASEQRAAEEVARKRVIWRLDPSQGDSYLLRNEGTHAAYDVSVDRGDLAVEDGTPDHFEEFHADHAERYLLVRTLASRTSALTVSWREARDGERKSQKLQLN
jgi:type II secretory pathway pseudopilin PulG